MVTKKKIIKFKKGELVRVLRKEKDFENGWNNNWNKSMDKSVGLVLEVIADNGNRGVRLNDGKYDLDYPRHVLVKVKKMGGKKNESNV
jgi:hypothetical protein